MLLQDATREIQWNVTPAMLWLMYASMVVALGIFGYGSWRRVRIWRVGRPEPRWDEPTRRLKRVLVHAVGQRSVLAERLPGLMHAAIFFGFLVLFAATVVVMVHHDLGIPIMRGRFYLYFQSLTANLFGLAAMVGVGIAAYRRWIRRDARLEAGKREDILLLGALFAILLTGFVVSGARIAATGDPWGAWRPASRLTGAALSALVPGAAGLEAVHAWTWTIHVLLWHALLAATPFTKMFHIVTSTLNIYAGNLGPRGELPIIDFKDAAALESLGVRTALDLTWKQLLDLDACTECGRCEAVCPAWAERKPLSPKRVILDTRDHVRAHSATLLAAAAAGRVGGPEARESRLAALPALAGEVIRPETLWACTTCGACEEVCPVSIEHVRLIVEMRRSLAMQRAELPQGVVDAMTSLEQRQHPFRGASVERTRWLSEPD